MTSARVTRRVGSRELSLSNLEKILWPKDGYTKGDLIAYYERVASLAIPHLKGRPLTLQRYPDGIDRQTFFEKQIPRGVPDWVERVTVPTPSGSRSHITFMLCNDAPTLVLLANLATIVLHVWTSRLPALEEPDFVIFDLDPGERCTLRTLGEVALGVRDLLGEIGLNPLVKTTGGYGLHVVLPLRSGYSYDTAKVFAEVVAREAARRLGASVTLQRAIAKRPQQAVYLDYVQVGLGKTIVAPYSVRARDEAPVSTPLHWSEVEAFARRRGTIAPADEFAKHTIATAPKRFAREGDLWGVRHWKKQRLEAAIRKAQRLWSQAG
ncbi:MAG: non-homologous end-joining DNA ligase [Candidatus Eremiobacteraeota bacterium]|nr:non-homologous end-joining DNA ligase [Candidatus Eremiobacteraeota bacterium]MBV8499833.1 non-homologous end-joining DNA ligase [Candidatus Eremiobacteraeota bacterium]